MKYAVDMGSGSMTHVPGFIKTGSAIKKLVERMDTDTQTAW
jgi:hypothetical protein